jgi:hypothetical protein
MKSIHHLAISTLTLAVSIVSGCAGATRLPMRTKGPAGETLQQKQVDLSFLDAPGTQRQDVLNRLNMVDTSYSNPRLFWARWSQSKWGYWWFIAGGNTAAGDAKRIWHIHNLLVAFDENGTVSKKEVIDNDQSLWPELHAQLATASAMDLSQPISLEVSGYRNLTKITLENDALELTRAKGKTPVLRISPQKIVRFSHSRPYGRFHSSDTCHTLHFIEKTEWGKSVFVCTSPANVATLFQYLQQAGPSYLRWN